MTPYFSGLLNTLCRCRQMWIQCKLIDAEWRIYASVKEPSLVQITACQCQAIIWTNAGILWVGPLGTNFSEILIGIHLRKFVWKYRLRNGVHFVCRPQCVNDDIGLVYEWLIITKLGLNINKTIVHPYQKDIANAGRHYWKSKIIQ